MPRQEQQPFSCSRNGCHGSSIVCPDPCAISPSHVAPLPAASPAFLFLFLFLFPTPSLANRKNAGHAA